MFKTNDRGESWDLITHGFKKNLWFVHFHNPDTGFVGGDLEGDLLVTYNGGQSWMVKSLSQLGVGNMRTIFFLNSQIGFLRSGYKLLRTTDGGEIWEVISNSIAGWELFFTDSLTGYSAGWYGEIDKSTDGGYHWIAQNSGTTETLRSIYFNDSATGLAVGWNGVVLKTTNGGINWNQINSNTTEKLRKLIFINKNIGYIVGGSGTLGIDPVILHTTDAGNGWDFQAAGIPQHHILHSVYFVDLHTGYIVGDYGKILKTTNGGIT